MRHTQQSYRLVCHTPGRWFESNPSRQWGGSSVGRAGTQKNVSCLQFNIVSSGLFKTWLGKEFGNSSQKLPRYSCVVQSVEQSAVNREVVGSSPITGASEGVSEQMRSFLYVNKNQ